MSPAEAILLCRRESAKRQRKLDALIEQARAELQEFGLPSHPTRAQRAAAKEMPKRAMSTTRTCRKCKLTKPFLDFYNRMTTCKLCHKLRTIELASRPARTTPKRARR